jgi:hypothetical protein
MGRAAPERSIQSLFPVWASSADFASVPADFHKYRETRLGDHQGYRLGPEDASDSAFPRVTVHSGPIASTNKGDLNPPVSTEEIDFALPTAT